MSVILVILKWLGILISIVIGLVLLLIALVLLVPVRYYVEAQNLKALTYSYRVSWLLRMFMVRKKMDSDEIWLYVFFIPVKCLSGKEPKASNAKKIKKSKTGESEDLREDDSRVKSIEVQEKDTDKENTGEKTDTKSSKEKPKGKRKKSFSFDTVSSIIDFVKDTRNRDAFRTVWGEVFQLLKHVSPQKVKGEFVIGTGDPSTTGLLFGGISLCPFVYDDGVEMIPDFEEKVFKAQGYVKGRVSVLYLVRLIIRVYQDRELRRLWRNINRINKKEAA